MQILFVEIACIITVVLCLILCLLYFRTGATLRSLERQLDEIEGGSHIELTIDSRQRPLIGLCKKLNHVLMKKDESHIQYERAERQLKQNIAGLAHDIRTPLTGASGYLQLAKECDDAGKREHYLEAAGRRLTELEDMLEEMFLYTKLTGEEFTLSRKRIQVLPLLSEALLGCYTRFEEAGVTPVVEFSSESFTVCADEEALRRIFLNLIQNYFVHGLGGFTITQNGDRITFENDLPKGSAPNPEQMFERFYKGEDARRKGSSGLGLFIVKELMLRMEGNVWAEISEKNPNKKMCVILCFATNDNQ